MFRLGRLALAASLVAALAATAVVDAGAWATDGAWGTRCLHRRPSRSDLGMAWYYSTPYGGLILPHSFGGLEENPPDILEGGGYLVRVAWHPDGSVDAFTLQTLQGRCFTYLVRPEVVPVNWEAELFRDYEACQCFVALHFTRRREGNVAIVLFGVHSPQID